MCERLVREVVSGGGGERSGFFGLVQGVEELVIRGNGLKRVTRGVLKVVVIAHGRGVDVAEGACKKI